MHVLLDSVALSTQASPLSLTLSAGGSLAIMGRPGSGKTHFLEVLVRRKRAPRGAVRLDAPVCTAGNVAMDRRSTPQSIATELVGRRATEKIAEALTRLGLWEVRRSSVTGLSPGFRAAADLLAIFLADPGVLVIDGHLDLLDPWNLESVLEGLAMRCQRGSSLVLTTARPDIAERCERLLVLASQRVVFCGTHAELNARFGPIVVEVQTNDSALVRQAVRPFQVRAVTQAEGTVRFEAEAGQAVVASLLRDGYGVVQSVTTRQRSFAEILSQLDRDTMVR
ncbi:MAG: ATP-binding cassette domain-containing protein [Chthonomonas sp.]|nr:ATP-binding cassette domain-containing protein [Chthonomonas sp.]